ncbi:ATP-binding protein [Pseudoflavitalea sp. G-6-1-2]|uniref:AAA family ATPase n=1 Tax=Pseudoflavitalea sp. G-6-1-2 TaxID=2728841 RepID=UPI00146ECC46|nr:AAA family ATPase [Pseudoflavitalea sp. G-6-1-2]NML19957.1 ATP-binding protein [Pseudoflavitalea sp. G-6-1-2]
MKKIVIIGPESTGKSTLCEQLSDHFGTPWVPEYAREYLLKNGTDYTYDNLLTIAQGQRDLEDEYAAALSKSSSPAGPLIIDTDQYVMKVWCEFVFQRCHQWILDQIVEHQYDLYLLCNIDLPWVRDELREYPDLESRKQLYHIHKDIMINQSVPWIDISGNYERRRSTAVDAVEKLMRQS